MCQCATATERSRQDDADQIRIELVEQNPDALTVDGFDQALVGYVDRCGCPALACYDYNLMVEVLVNRDQMSREDAIEYIDFNVVGAWMGDGTPVFLHRTGEW
jgi:hypothetical protein